MASKKKSVVSSAKILKVDGYMYPIENDQLETVYAAIHAETVAVVYLKDKSVMLVNEDGMLLQLPINHAASIVARQMIVGDVVISDNAARLY